MMYLRSLEKYNDISANLHTSRKLHEIVKFNRKIC